MSKIELHHISHRYGTTPVLDDVNLTIRDGEFFTLTGPSGCGKTTLLRIIAGFITGAKGDILMDGISINATPPEKRNIGFVFQNYALFPHMTVWENICYGLKIKKLSKSQISDTAAKYLNLVDMEQYRDRKIHELSGGQQQRVAVARSLAIEPSVLLLDEPMSNLDVSLREEMRTEIRSIQQKLGITTIFVTHDQEEALCLSDRIAIFHGGKCLQCDTPEEIYFHPNCDFVAGFLGKTNILSQSYLQSKGIFIQEEKLYLRPEMLEITSQPSEHSIPAVITKKQFSGSVTRYTCQDEAQTFLIDQLSRSKGHAVGEKVFLRILH